MLQKKSAAFYVTPLLLFGCTAMLSYGGRIAGTISSETSGLKGLFLNGV
jgi:hypothetical protein